MSEVVIPVTAGVPLATRPVPTDDRSPLAGARDQWIEETLRRRVAVEAGARSEIAAVLGAGSVDVTRSVAEDLAAAPGHRRGEDTAAGR